MKLTEIRTVQAFTFQDEEKGTITNIYIDPTGHNRGRVILYVKGKIFTHYLNACHPGIFMFLAKVSLEGFCGMFEVQMPAVSDWENEHWVVVTTNTESDDDFDADVAQYEFLITHMTPIWPQIVELFQMPYKS